MSMGRMADRGPVRLYDTSCPYCGVWVKRSLLTHVRANRECLEAMRSGEETDWQEGHAKLATAFAGLCPEEEGLE